jgi:hypothetical protein
MTTISILSDFKKSLIDFFDNLIELFPEEGQLLVYRISLKEVPSQDIMIHFQQNIYPQRDLIKKRNEDFFTKVNLLGMGGNENNYLRNIWLSPDLEEGDKKSIWKWMDKFMNLVEKYGKSSQ